MTARRVTQEEYDKLYDERLAELDSLPGGAQGARPDMSDVMTESDEWVESPPTVRRQRTRLPHPEGFHKSPEAKARCYGCSAPEKLEPTEADFAKARQLIAAGYLSTSNRYCHVSRAYTPPFETAITFSPDVPKWMREEMERAYEGWQRWGARVHGEHVKLTRAEFIAFKQLGGESA